MPRGQVTLADFLLARIAEDEADIRSSGLDDALEWWMRDMTTAVRLLAECEVKRRLVEMHRHDDPGWGTLRTLAIVYSDHPDYRQEWKP